MRNCNAQKHRAPPILFVVAEKPGSVPSCPSVNLELSQAKAPQIVTAPKAATAASKVLRDGRTSKDSKAAVGSEVFRGHNNNINLKGRKIGIISTEIR